MRRGVELSKCEWCECTYIQSRFPHLVFPSEMIGKFGREYRVSKYKKFCSEECHGKERLYWMCRHLEQKKREEDNKAV